MSLIAIALPLLLVAQDERKPAADRAGQSCEVRVFLLDKSHKEVELKDVSASLVLEDKSGKPARTIPMILVTPRDSEKIGTACSGQKVPVEGTDYSAELCVMQKAVAGDAPVDKRPRPGDSEDDRIRAHRGSYFKAELTKEQEPAKDGTASVHFTIQGKKHVASGFSCSTAAGKAEILRCQQEVRALEQAIDAHDMPKAKAAAARLCEAMQASPGKEGHKEECAENCGKIKAALDAGDRDQASKVLEKCKKKLESRLKDND